MAGSEAAGKVNIDQVQLRACTTLEEFTACLELQREVWGFSDLDLVPLRVFSLAAKIGGQVIAAWDGDTIVGFALSVPGTHRRYPYLHSHMLGVKESYRNTGLGRRIKLYQREDAIARGVDLIEWTFDPLELKNAYFNLVRLGAIARRFIPNLYGVTRSPMHAGLPTDRLVAEWWINSSRVHSALASATPEKLAAPATGESVDLPSNIGEIKAIHQSEAAKIQKEMARQFEKAFAKDHVVTGVQSAGKITRYVLQPTVEISGNFPPEFLSRSDSTHAAQA